ncbi:hypothetical protein HGRIS_005454 [Hohenbuehelia grisea]|uniref:MYND-type domain-containing protein n=1 Tax=Hohenbuehelia grisea TaxID=104357 RepID=A0ABR3JXW3_9AGAR
MASNLVEKFNNLPRGPKSPSGMCPNHWHFDLRFMPIDPVPLHILYFIQPDSFYSHTENLPERTVEPENRVSVFFPETPQEAAGPIALAILRAFTNNVFAAPWETATTSSVPPIAPWKLMTDNEALAAAVGAELRRLGVKEEVCAIGISSPSIVEVARESHEELVRTMLTSLRVSKDIEKTFKPPSSLSFDTVIASPPPWLQRDLDHSRLEADMPLQSKLAYARIVHNAKPGSSLAPACVPSLLADSVQKVERLLNDKPESTVKKEAEAGLATSMVDYGLRLYLGLHCTANRFLAREWLVKATHSARAPDRLKAVAHAILALWFVEVRDGMLTSRHFYSGSHHASQAARLGQSVAGMGCVAPLVLELRRQTFKPLASTENYCQAKYFYQDLWSVPEQGSNVIRRRKESDMYRCASVGCGIEGSTEKMLMQCSGKCDLGKKPVYCGRDCQTADWKNHKPFCKPGMSCSVIDDSNDPAALPSASSPSVGSYLVTPALLKDVKVQLGKREQRHEVAVESLAGALEGLQVDVYKMG